MKEEGSFKCIKPIIFGKDDEQFFKELNDTGYFDKDWNEKIKKLMKADFYAPRVEDEQGFNEKQKGDILYIVKNYIDNKLDQSVETIKDIAQDIRKNIKNIEVSKEQTATTQEETTATKQKDDNEPSEGAKLAYESILAFRNKKD
jgi:hypothetical protein